MDLWIRSQFKNGLIKASTILVEECEIIVKNETNTNTKYSVATYKTKERALEVLDEIQKKIKNMLYLKPKRRF